MVDASTSQAADMEQQDEPVAEGPHRNWWKFAGKALLFVLLGLILLIGAVLIGCLLYTTPSPRDRTRSRMPSSA